MSASERLRALNEAEDYGQLGDSTDALWTALPLIADVVEAAEWVAENGRTYVGIPLPDGKPSGRVHYPLRDALTALREQLEGDDVT